MAQKQVAFFFIFSIITSNLFCQQHHYQNLIMEGGGVRGFAYIGAFEVLDSMGILKEVQRVGGSSVGAIQAALLATGYTTAEMKTVAANIPLKTFNDGFLPGGFHRLKKNLGWYKGKAVSAWIAALIKNKTGDENITFRQLHEQKIKNHYKDLYITGTDLTYQCLRVFSYETYPDMRIKDALRISMSVPLYFQPVYMKENGSITNKKDTASLHLMSDGGLLSNYPIQIFDDEKYGECVTIFGQKQNKQTLGLLLEKPEQIEYNKNKKGNYPLPIKTVRNYIGAMYRTLVDKPNPEASNNALLHRTITISNLNISGRVRQLSPATVDAFIEAGRQGVRNFFKP